MGHPKVTEKCGIGQRKDPSKPRTKIKAMSTKQRTRTDLLAEKFKVVLKVQRELYDYNFCASKWGHPEWPHVCSGKLKLTPDHVMTRNQVNADRFENLQPLCSWCQYIKGSRRIDFRPKEYKEALQRLDEQEKSPQTFI